MTTSIRWDWIVELSAKQIHHGGTEVLARQFVPSRSPPIELWPPHSRNLEDPRYRRTHADLACGNAVACLEPLPTFCTGSAPWSSYIGRTRNTPTRAR